MVDMRGVGKNHQVTQASQMPADDLEKLGEEVAEMRHKIHPTASQHQKKQASLSGRATHESIGPTLNAVVAHNLPNHQGEAEEA